MAPTYDSFSFTLTQPVNRPLERGDVVVVNLPNRGRIVKRVAYIAGDVIQQYRTVAGWSNLIGVRVSPHVKKANLRFHEIPEGQIFLMGDNSNCSEDSRMFGTVSVNRVERIVADPKPYEVPAWTDPMLSSDRVSMRLKS